MACMGTLYAKYNSCAIALWQKSTIEICSLIDKVLRDPAGLSQLDLRRRLVVLAFMADSRCYLAIDERFGNGFVLARTTMAFSCEM